MSYPMFDAHLHIIDPKFPLKANQGYLPPTFTTKDYEQAKPTEVIGGAVVSGSFQGFDQTYLIDSLEKLGPSFVGVTQLPHEVSDEEIIMLAQKGVRALRFNFFRGGSEGLDQLITMAERVYDLANWHVEMYADAATLTDIVPTLTSLPQIVIDHLGMSKEGLPTLLKLVENGAKVKATGFSRVSLDIPEALKAITHANPDALMFATDLPCTRAPKPFTRADIDLIIDTLDEATCKQVFFENAYNLYKPKIDKN